MQGHPELTASAYVGYWNDLCAGSEGFQGEEQLPRLPPVEVVGKSGGSVADIDFLFQVPVMPRCALTESQPALLPVGWVSLLGPAKRPPVVTCGRIATIGRKLAGVPVSDPSSYTQTANRILGRAIGVPVALALFVFGTIVVSSFSEELTFLPSLPS
jgi:hypothetical protein